MSASRNGQLVPYARLGWVMSCMMYAARCSAWTICTDWSCVREITVPLSSTAPKGQIDGVIGRTERGWWTYHSRLCAAGVGVLRVAAPVDFGMCGHLTTRY